MTQTTGSPGTGDYGPEVAGRPGSVDYAPDRSERLGFHIGSHTLEMGLSAAAVVLAAVGTLLIAWPSAHLIGGWVSLVGILVGLYAQLTSDTTYERMVNVCAIGLAAVAFAFHIHHGGLW